MQSIIKVSNKQFVWSSLITVLFMNKINKKLFFRKILARFIFRGNECLLNDIARPQSAKIGCLSWHFLWQLWNDSWRDCGFIYLIKYYILFDWETTHKLVIVISLKIFAKKKDKLNLLKGWFIISPILDFYEIIRQLYNSKSSDSSFL